MTEVLSRQAIIDKLMKIKALADNGSEGEKDNARVLLNSLMDKYGITDGELDTTKLYFFKYNKFDSLSRKLLKQIIYSVLGDMHGDVYREGQKANLGLECTKSEAVEIEARYAFYYPALQEDMKLLVKAFIMRNRIYPPESKVKDDGEEATITDEDRKALALSEQLTKRVMFKQLKE